MATRTFSSEGVPSGAALTLGNTASGSGTPPDVILNTLTCDTTTPANGTKCIRIDASSAAAQFRWEQSVSEAEWVFKVRYPTLLGSDHWIFTASAGGISGTKVAWLEVNNAFKVRLRTSAGIIWTAPTAFSAGPWYRIEVYYKKGTTSTTGTLRVDVYLGDNTTPEYSFTTGVNNQTLGTSNVDCVVFGKHNAVTLSAAYFIDSMGQDDAPGGHYVWDWPSAVANAGADMFNIEPGDIITLDGSSSMGVIAYSWECFSSSSGPKPDIVDPTTVHPTYRAPATFDGTDLVFKLTVNGVYKDDVVHEVLPHLEWLKSGGVWVPLYRV